MRLFSHECKGRSVFGMEQEGVYYEFWGYPFDPEYHFYIGNATEYTACGHCKESFDSVRGEFIRGVTVSAKDLRERFVSILAIELLR